MLQTQELKSEFLMQKSSALSPMLPWHYHFLDSLFLLRKATRRCGLKVISPQITSKEAQNSHHSNQPSLPIQISKTKQNSSVKWYK